jgi:hypothetical protein
MKAPWVFEFRTVSRYAYVSILFTGHEIQSTLLTRKLMVVKHTRIRVNE